jgi:hypothetical protein
MRRNRKYLKEKKVREEGSEAEAATDSTPPKCMAWFHAASENERSIAFRKVANG